MTLMEKLAEAGYAREDFFHHNSDLYVYATETTQRVLNDWFKEQNLDRNAFVKTFKDQITGRTMYDVAFQYTPYWEERCEAAPDLAKSSKASFDSKLHEAYEKSEASGLTGSRGKDKGERDCIAK